MITIDDLKKGQTIQITRKNKTGFETHVNEKETAEVRKVYRTRGQIYVWTTYGYGYNLNVKKHQEIGGAIVITS